MDRSKLQLEHAKVAWRNVEYMEVDQNRFHGLPGMQAKWKRLNGDFRDGFSEGLLFAIGIMEGRLDGEDARLYMVEGFLRRRAIEDEQIPF